VGRNLGDFVDGDRLGVPITLDEVDPGDDLKVSGVFPSLGVLMCV
jgi:hypothetical protein